MNYRINLDFARENHREIFMTNMVALKSKLVDLTLIFWFSLVKSILRRHDLIPFLRLFGILPYDECNVTGLKTTLL